ncbi:Transcription activator of gluconeogenesis [Talaromyces atroroseus]|uniref:Transcription activator of gluconeogenesis n=1 Tax=Talaromyces atroroseus TaxID=1441469 RepID=A0A1Q5Q793_TALAT|nr:Transcription activator of gluconeogenesis [Talaromyces atroroseus]OKL55716.1 Transcription activator of gluconeogenesis [Talaromyces atroroseus]
MMDVDNDKDDLPSATDHSEHESADMVKVDGAARDTQKPASNSKDPSRPRRKKARRACFACQRAHLTCGDERPCQRCIKRGLQDACHDGVRKKAKYLHDAPDGALMPGAGGGYFNQGNGLPKNATNNFAPNGNNAQQPQPKPNNIYTGSTPAPAPTFNANGSFDANTTPSQVLTDSASMNPGPFTATPASPTFSISASSAIPNISQPASDMAPGTGAAQNSFGAFFDPSDPALFNFDLASMNFGNRYGALEFGMLGHMATGAGDTPPSDSGAQRGSIGQRSNSQQFGTPAPGTFTDSPNQQSFMFGDPVLNEWSTGQNPNRMGLYGQGGMHLLQQQQKQDAPHAYAIGSGAFASPSSTTSPHTSTAPAAAFEESPMKTKTVISTPHLRHQSLYTTSNKRRLREPSAIYESVKEPYSYTGGFHKLIAYIKRRFSPPKTVRIAKALASIRPSFIATTKTLDQDDLIFMERCFQRTLWEYEDFINACGTPTIVCRRTGEVAAVGKEFSILTGWKKEILLGKEPNMNVNTGNPQSSEPNPFSSSLSRSSGGASGPGPRLFNQDNSNTAAVFLAELLDDDSVIEFYEDFARLAFGDSRGSVMNTCKLLKYKTKEDMDLVKTDDGRWNSAAHHVGKGGIVGEAGMNRLGFKDGRVECSYCWTVKRDVFDIPMLIVMNFLPHI